MKILIVDDERYSVKAIRERVQWDSVCPDGAEVLAAYNYDQALKIITEEDPSIILCDIEMPRHNGIELIRELRKSNTEAEIIIITCHEEFRFAREAITLDVFEYCVKPLDFIVLTDTIRRAAERYLEKKSIKAQEADAQQFRKNREAISQIFWQNLVTGSYENDPDRLFSEAGSLGIDDVRTCLFTPALFVVRQYSTRLTTWTQEKLSKSLQHIAEQIFLKANGRIIVTLPAAILVLDSETSASSFEVICGNYVRNCDELLSVRLGGYIGNPVTMDKLCKSCQLLDAKAGRDRNTDASVVFVDTSEDRENEDDDSAVVKQIEAYIDLHLSEDLRREDIADHVHLNPDYCSRIFKKARGISLMDYVAAARIHRAAEYIITTQDSLTDIAYRCGFINLSHFSTLFRKLMGCSPREYRQSYQETAQTDIQQN